MLEAGSTLAPYQPPPVEDDEVTGGIDEIGMAPEIEVDLEAECEDLNADLRWTDSRTHSSSIRPGQPLRWIYILQIIDHPWTCHSTS